MKKIFIVLFSLAILTSCANSKTPETTNSGSQTQTESNQANSQNETKITKYVKYTLRDTDENGEILDTNEDSSEALKVVMWTNSVIKGFEENIKDMKEWETKSFTVLPKDGYGEATVIEENTLDAISPTSLQTVSKESLKSKNIITVQKSELTEEWLNQFKDKKAGETIEDNEIVKVVLIEETEESVKIEIENKTHPFKNKELTVGLQVEDENGVYKIIAIDEENVSLEFTNKHSIFYNQEIKVGTSVKTEHGEFTIVEIDGNKVKIRVPNNNRLAGKTLHFTVKIEKIEEEKTNQKQETEFNIENTENIENISE